MKKDYPLSSSVSDGSSGVGGSGSTGHTLLMPHIIPPIGVSDIRTEVETRVSSTVAQLIRQGWSRGQTSAPPCGIRRGKTRRGHTR